MAELFRQDVKKALHELAKEKACNVTAEDVKKAKEELNLVKYKPNEIKMVNYLNELDDLYEVATGKTKGITTGIKCIDDAIGMLKKDELFILGGGSGAGKSLIATNIMAKLIRENKKVIYVGLEMGFGATFERLASIMYRIHPAFFRGKFSSEKAIEQEYKNILEFCEQMRKNNNWQILGLNEFENPTSENIMATCKAVAKANGWKQIDLIIIDYLQYIPTLPNKTEYDTVNDSIQKLKGFVVGEKIPVLALSSLNADGSLKGSTNIRFTGDFVAMVNPIENSDDRVIAIVKNRYGNFATQRIAYTQYLQVEEKGAY